MIVLAWRAGSPDGEGGSRAKRVRLKTTGLRGTSLLGQLQPSEYISTRIQAIVSACRRIVATSWSVNESARTPHSMTS